MMSVGVASAFSIASQRLSCAMLSMAKRGHQAVAAGQAEILVADAGAASPSSAPVQGWIVAVAVIGALLALVAVVAIVYFVFVWKKNPLDENWERY
jgi:hypothetical protein